MKAGSNMEEDRWSDPMDEKEDREDPNSPEARLAVKAEERRNSKNSKSNKKGSQKSERSKPKALASTISGSETDVYSADSSEFNFEIIRHYPIVRAFSIKKPLKKSFMDSITDLLGSK